MAKDTWVICIEISFLEEPCLPRGSWGASGKAWAVYLTVATPDPLS